MAQEKVYAVPNVNAPNAPVIIDDELCIGCNKCVEICMIDVFIPNPVAGKPPLTLHPDECWYCGSCVLICPIPGAITFNWPMMQRVNWKHAETGERFRA